MKLLVIGANGQVGWELTRSLMPLGSVFAVDRHGCDLTCPEDIQRIVRAVQPNVIINAAAYTAVDKAEQEEVLAHTINGTAAGVIAEEAKKANALLIHYSTDYVFDGSKHMPYSEEDIPNPINSYGRSKLAGETAIIESQCDHLILRTSWVYALRAQNFVKTILRLAQEREELRIIDDQIGAPTWARSIADATAHIIRQAQYERKIGNFEAGIFNLASSGSTSWYGFARMIVETAKSLPLGDAIKLREIHPIPTESYPLPAPRPKNSRLDNEKLLQRFNLKMPEWQAAFACCMQESN